MLDNRYMSVSETAQYLNIGRSMAYKVVKTDPSFPIIRIGTKILVDKYLLESVWIPNKEKTSLR